MTIPITGQPPVPGLDDPATFNTKSLNLFTWITGSMLEQFNNVDPSDFFGVEAFATAAQGAKADALSGRNLIINGTGRINQRDYVSGTPTVAANRYTLDRWRVSVSGQSLTFTGTAAGRVMTAPNGGVDQVIEGANIVGGSYVLNWTGTAVARIDGTPRAKGETFTLASGANATVRFVNGTFSDAQLEQGTVPTPFERVDAGAELAMCQRYYWRGLPATSLNFPSYAAGAIMSFLVSFPVHMRAAPTVGAIVPGAVLSGCTLSAFDGSTNTGARLVLTSTAATINANISFVGGNYLEADAEL